jgi:hypothetical protein
MSLLFWLAPLAASAAVAGALLRYKRLRNRRLYQQSLERALSDGILTDDETRELASVRQERELSEAEVRMVALSLYRRALRDAVADSRITEEESEVLQRLKTGEHCHWVIQARLADRLSTPGRKSELRNVHFDVAGTSAFSAEGERSELRSSEEILPIDMGVLLVTDRRTLFRGARRTVNLPHLKLVALDLYQDGVAVEEGDPARRTFFIVDDPELSAAVLLRAARDRRRDVSGLTTRTA